VPDSPWRLLRDLMRPQRRALGTYGAVLSVATALPLVASLLLARFVTLAVEGAPARRLVPLALGYAGCGLAVSFVTVAVTWRATTLAWRITDGLRHELALRVLRADLRFHRDRTPGELVTRVDADVTAMT
jgi:ABC-type bacteriocin/lantibiotic exporter with double-glycine peptidase domain